MTFTPGMMPKRRPDHTTSVQSAEPDTYTLSGHAAQQATAKGWHPDEVLQAANDPHTTYANGRVPGQMRHIRGDVVAVVDPIAKKVVTLYKNVTETNLRPDQQDHDALRYNARRLQGR